MRPLVPRSFGGFLQYLGSVFDLAPKGVEAADEIVDNDACF